MDIDVLKTIFETCVFPLLAVVTAYIIKFVNKKSAEIDAKIDNETATKYINLLSNTIKDCVESTNQCYVNVLKAEGKFGKKEQEEAFRITYKKIMDILSVDAQKVLSTIYSDMYLYISTTIESIVLQSKKEGSK